MSLRALLATAVCVGVGAAAAAGASAQTVVEVGHSTTLDSRVGEGPQPSSGRTIWTAATMTR